MEKSERRAVVDVHVKNKEEARKYQEVIRETELNLLEFINTTIEIDDTKNNPEMVSALAGLFKVVKQTFQKRRDQMILGLHWVYAVMAVVGLVTAVIGITYVLWDGGEITFEMLTYTFLMLIPAIVVGAQLYQSWRK